MRLQDYFELGAGILEIMNEYNEESGEGRNANAQGLVEGDHHHQWKVKGHAEWMVFCFCFVT